MQTGMQISPELWRRFIRPRWQEILNDVRARCPGTRTFLHSCGNIREIVPDIVELGFNVLHPIQPECMDFAEIRREFGRHIALCATISSQRTLPFGTPEDVRREVRRLKELAGEDRRCILCPSNLIQPETPWANILAFAEEARADR
jgi:uroporphyrinogen decarboxylase